MIINLIRHGKTAGNELKRYIGITDESLSEKGMEELKAKKYNFTQTVLLSPMKRCIKTCDIIFGKNCQRIIVDGFKECDFGEFEGKNYIELSGNENYQSWIDSGGTKPFPGGEDVTSFKQRIINAFERILPQIDEKDEITIIAHGGTIMSILEHFESSHEYYKWQCDNGCGFIVEFEKNEMKVIGKI